MTTYVTRKRGDLKGKGGIQDNQLTKFGLTELFFNPQNRKTPTIFLLNVSHDGCRCKISGWLLINET